MLTHDYDLFARCTSHAGRVDTRPSMTNLSSPKSNFHLSSERQIALGV
jgi:hypothetical protein